MRGASTIIWLRAGAGGGSWGAGAGAGGCVGGWGGAP